MKKTILFSLLSSFFAANASAAILNVEGKIQINGTTVLEEVNLMDYESSKDYVKYTAEACTYSERDCGTFTKVITKTSKDNYEYKTVEVRDPHGELLSKHVFTRDGAQYSSENETYNTIYIPDGSTQRWVDVNGKDITIKDMPVYQGMAYADCSDDGSCETKYWQPSEGDVYTEPELTKETQVNKVRTTWTESVISGNDDRVIIGIPSVSVTKITDSQSSNTVSKISDGESRVVEQWDSKNNEKLDISNRTVLAKIPTFGKYSDCIILSGEEIKCRGVGTVQQNAYEIEKPSVWNLSE